MCHTQEPNNSLTMSLMLSLQKIKEKKILSEQQKSDVLILPENWQKALLTDPEKAFLHELQNFSLFFKVKRAFCCATFMSCFPPIVLCPLPLRVLPDSILQVWVPFEQPFCSSSWDRKNIFFSSYLACSNSPSSVFPSLPRKLPVWSYPVCWGRAALGGTSWTLGRWERQQEKQAPVQGRSPRAHPDTLQKAEQQDLGAARREGPNTLSKRMKNIDS